MAGQAGIMLLIILYNDSFPLVGLHTPIVVKFSHITTKCRHHECRCNRCEVSIITYTTYHRFMLYLYLKFHKLSSNGILINAVKPKTGYRFRAVAMILFHITRNSGAYVSKKLYLTKYKDPRY
jgi:hypothetical protein